MFERFTEGAIKTIMLAQEEARRLGHNFVGTEQMLLGIVGIAEGHSKKVLKEHHVKLDLLRREVEKIIGRGTGFVSVEIPFTPRAKTSLESAWAVAKELSVNYISVDHLFLGILSQDPQAVSLQALKQMNVDPMDLRREMYAALGATEPASLARESWIVDPAVARFAAVRITLSDTAKYLSSLPNVVSEQLKDKRDPGAAERWRNASGKLIEELERLKSDLQRLTPEIYASIDELQARLRDIG